MGQSDPLDGADVEFADEGEEEVGGANSSLLIEPPTSSSETGTATQFSLRGKIRRAWQILRGKDVEVLTADPDGAIRQARAHQDNRWRGVYALVLLIAMVGQVVFADWIFVRYLDENAFDIEPAIFIAFLTSVVVEVIGLVLVITQSLFPRAKDDKVPASGA